MENENNNITYFDTLENLLEELNKESKKEKPDVAKIKAISEAIATIGKRNTEDDVAYDKVEIERLKVENEANSNRLKEIELEQQSVRDDENKKLEEMKLEQSDKDSKRRVLCSVLTVAATLAAIGINIAGANGYLDHYSSIQEHGVAIGNINQKMIPSFFTKNKPL